jgi:hypothetical protein
MPRNIRRSSICGFIRRFRTACQVNPFRQHRRSFNFSTFASTVWCHFQCRTTCKEEELNASTHIPIMPESRVVNTGANERRQLRILYIVTRASTEVTNSSCLGCKRARFSSRGATERRLDQGMPGHPGMCPPPSTRDLPIADVRAFCNLYVLLGHGDRTGFITLSRPASGRLVACLPKRHL